MIGLPDLPYPGLRAFARDENIIFFGREGCIDQMLTTLAESRFLAVLGASGGGKSSLVRTGLITALERGMLVKGGADWVVADFHPGSNPLRALAEALAPGGDGDQLDALESYLGAGPPALVEWARLGNLAPGKSLLLVVDQFEELFRYGNYADREAAEAFVALLLHSAASADAPIYVVLTMRSEYLGNCSLIPSLAERISNSLYLPPRMDRDCCREAILGPGHVFGFTIEPKLVNQILNDMARVAPFEPGGQTAEQQLSRRADQLPLMQHLLNRLWTRARAAGDGPVVLGFADYEAVGGLQGALNSHGAGVLEGLAPDLQDSAARVFRALVDGADPASAVRRPLPMAALLAEAGPQAHGVVEAFRSHGCNFLRPQAPAPLTDDTVVDISHESLIRQWSRLSEWLRQEAAAAANWHFLRDHSERHADGHGDLLAGETLRATAQWWDVEAPSAAWAGRYGGNYPAVAAYLAQSRTAWDSAQALEASRARHERMMLIGLMASLALLLVVAVGFIYSTGSYRAIITERATLKAEAARLAAESGRLRGEQAILVANVTKMKSEADRLNAGVEAIRGEKDKIKTEKDLLSHTLDINRQELDASARRSEKIKSFLQNANADRLDAYCEGHANEKACRIYLGTDGAAAGSHPR